ncbi:peptidoglycan binding protein CsiV [Gammaproteobacteria bacterium]|nr:peptidoglycan binding protein CsiV [Gammaproteobacteria bacterium]
MYLIKQIKERLYQHCYISYLKTTFIILLSLGVSSTAHGQELKEYSVEVIIFEQLEVSTNEAFLKQTIDLSPMNLISLLEKPSIEEEDQAEEILGSTENLLELILEDTQGIARVEEAEERLLQIDKWFERSTDLKELDNIHRRLNRRQEYKILHKFSWLQPALPEADAPFIHETFGQHGLAIRVYQSRYLHLDLLGYLNGTLVSSDNRALINAIKQSASPQSEELETNEPSLTKLATQETQETQETQVLEGEVSYVLREDRRIFKNESHFFDHPKMGIIVSVYDSPL